MLALEVEIDGVPLARAGIEDWSVLSLAVCALRGGHDPNPLVDNDLRLSLGGLTLPDSEGVRHQVAWAGAELPMGSQVTFRFIDTETVDPARRRYPEHRVKEPRFTEGEIRDSHHPDVRDLKMEVEPDPGRWGSWLSVNVFNRLRAPR